MSQRKTAKNGLTVVKVKANRKSAFVSFDVRIEGRYVGMVNIRRLRNELADGFEVYVANTGSLVMTESGPSIIVEGKYQ